MHPCLKADDTLVLATHNTHKINELSQLLAGLALKLKHAGDFQLTEPLETGATLHENAAIKAKAVAIQTGMWALADDSGLFIDALQGEPGVVTADWCGDDKKLCWQGIEKVLSRLANETNRAAHFACVLCLAHADGTVYFFEGRTDGTIATRALSQDGMAYDKIFVPNGFDVCFATMSQQQKNELSHRGNAMKKMRHQIEQWLR